MRNTRKLSPLQVSTREAALREALARGGRVARERAQQSEGCVGRGGGRIHHRVIETPNAKRESENIFIGSYRVLR